MPAAIVLIDREPFLKTSFLGALDTIGNTASTEQLEQIAKSLSGGSAFVDLLEGLTSGEHGVPRDEIDHVSKDWFHAEQGWWRDHSPERVMRDGLVEAIRIQVDKRDASGRPLPVGYWWLPNAHKFAFIPLLGKGQLTVVVTTPPIPQPTAAGRPRKKASAKKSAPRKKAGKKKAAPAKKSAKKKTGKKKSSRA
ncbi:MAG TPA: hypothetical protein VHZ95_21940 [Polyangiales bacterium]|jgi:hypothetical protein|nr:hypothetical protein [Polyangiales bacterium]